MAYRYFNTKKLTVAQQAVALRGLYPEAQCKSRRENLHWTGLLTPSPLSASYTVTVVYRKDASPKTYVCQPKLIVPVGKSLPHVYSQKEQRLCLYYPRGGREWNESMSIARTIVPWASEWLFFYELWLATGDWLGGGIHIETGKEDPS